MATPRVEKDADKPITTETGRKLTPEELADEVRRLNAAYEAKVRNSPLTRKEQDDALSWFLSQPPGKERVKAYKGFEKQIEKFTNFRESVRQKYLQLRDNECAQPEAAKLADETTTLSWTELEERMKVFDRDKQKGVEQTRKFTDICEAAKRDGLLAAGDELVAREKYAHAFYDERKAVIAQLKAFIEHHKESLKALFQRLDTLPRGQFSASDIQWFKRDVIESDAQGRRWRIQNYDTWVLAWQDKRETRGREWIADMRAVPEEHLAAREREQIIAQFLASDAAGRRKFVMDFEGHRQLGEQQYQRFASLTQAAHTSGTLDSTTYEKLRTQFIHSTWDERRVLVQRLESGTDASATVIDDGHGRYFSKRFEAMIETIAVESKGHIDYYGAKQDALLAGAKNVDFARVSVVGDNSAPAETEQVAQPTQSAQSPQPEVTSATSAPMTQPAQPEVTSYTAATTPSNPRALDNPTLYPDVQPVTAPTLNHSNSKNEYHRTSTLVHEIIDEEANKPLLPHSLDRTSVEAPNNPAPTLTPIAPEAPVVPTDITESAPYQDLERNAAEVIVRQGLLRHAKNQGAVSQVEVKTRHSFVKAFFNRRDRSAHGVVEEVRAMRARNELNEEDIKRLEQAA